MKKISILGILAILVIVAEFTYAMIAGWVEISQEGQILLTKKMMDFLKVRPGMELLSIRSSDIAFTMGAKGPLLEKAENYDGEIPLF